jgi:hypothetical protein
MTRERKRRMPRLWDWMAATVAAAAAVAVIAPQQFQVVAYKVSLITLALVLAYWADRSLFSQAPDRIERSMPRDALAAARVIARAMIVLAVVLGVTLGI